MIDCMWHLNTWPMYGEKFSGKWYVKFCFLSYSILMQMDDICVTTIWLSNSQGLSFWGIETSRIICSSYKSPSVSMQNTTSKACDMESATAIWTNERSASSIVKYIPCQVILLYCEICLKKSWIVKDLYEEQIILAVCIPHKFNNTTYMCCWSYVYASPKELYSSETQRNIFFVDVLSITTHAMTTCSSEGSSSRSTNYIPDLQREACWKYEEKRIQTRDAAV